MLITAKREGFCTACSAPIAEGKQVEWDRLFGARCLACNEARRYPVRPNGRSEACARCSAWLPAGTGILQPAGKTGWQVRCRDIGECATRAEIKKREVTSADVEASTREQLAEAFVEAHRGGVEVLITVPVTWSMLVPGGWPEGADRAEEWAVLTDLTGRAWLARYKGESDGTWLRPRQRRDVAGVELTVEQAMQALKLSIGMPTAAP